MLPVFGTGWEATSLQQLIPRRFDDLRRGLVHRLNVLVEAIEEAFNLTRVGLILRKDRAFQRLGQFYKQEPFRRLGVIERDAHFTGGIGQPIGTPGEFRQAANHLKKLPHHRDRGRLGAEAFGEAVHDLSAGAFNPTARDGKQFWPAH